MDPILEGLNAAQHAAVTSPVDVIQVLAPPGSGKTKTLTARIAYLLQYHHYKPWNIICLTFTIKSSREMKARIAKLIGNGIESKLILGTFHSVCRRYLVAYGHKIGIFKNFGIADTSDTMNIIKRIIKRLRVNMDPRKAHSRISSSKSRGFDHAEVPQENAKKTVEQQEFAMVFEAYSSQLAKSNLLDYDDLLLRTVDLLRQHPTCVSNVEVVLIDEFQDTNLVQFELMRLFAATYKRVTTVGDPDQSIYGWRSAEIRNLKRMQRQYPETLVVHLEENYRSSAAILLAAQEVIEQDGSRPSKYLSATHCPCTQPVLRRLPTAENEALWIVSEILRTVAMTGRLLTFDDFAILLRSAALSRQIESAMGKAGIAYRMVGGQKFFDRVEVKILLDYLRVINQPYNNDAVSRILNIPARGVGATTVKALLEEAETRKMTLWSLVRGISRGHTTAKTRISKAAEQGLGSFITIILTTQKKLNDTSTTHSPEALLRHLIKKFDFQAYLEKQHADDHESRWANVEELVAQAAEFQILEDEDVIEDQDDRLPYIEDLQQERNNAAGQALSKFLANVALATDVQLSDQNIEGGKTRPQVTISTIHASKGLEWPVVFVPSAYEGCIPHSRAEDTDEERRLLYVAMTRAQALLSLSYPIKNSQGEETTLSAFLSTKKVGKHLVNKGPRLDASTVNDICRILGRQHPAEAQVLEASSGLRSCDDDLWPLGGKEDVNAVSSRWTKWDDSGFIDHASKRRRIKEDFKSSNLYTVSTVGSTTTMKSGFTFTTEENSGFITATTQLQHTAQEEAVRQNAITKGRRTAPIFDKENLRPVIKTKPRPVSSGKGSLLSLWGMEDKTKGRSDSNLIPGVLEEQNKDLPTAYDSPLRPPGPEVAFTNRDLTLPEKSIAEKPPSAIPSTLAAHRLQPMLSKSRPYLAASETEKTRNQYFFLSSSPTPIQPLLEEAEAPIEAASSLESSGAILVADTMPAKTLHTTTVSQLKSASKKTLGVRRSMNGWSARSNLGFSVPRMNGSRP